MRGLERNKTTFYYALYAGEIALTDDAGDYTGEYESTYTAPVVCAGNVSPASGAAVTELFGTVADYDRVIGPLPRSLPIDEHSRIWIAADAGTEAPDYYVKRRADSINHMMILVARTEAGHG